MQLVLSPVAGLTVDRCRTCLDGVLYGQYRCQACNGLAMTWHVKRASASLILRTGTRQA